jgi:hypothetical protein
VAYAEKAKAPTARRRLSEANLAQHPHQVWGMDFQFAATADVRRLKFLNVICGHSPLCVTIRVGRRWIAKMWWRWWRFLPASSRRQRLSGWTTGRSSFRRLYGAGVSPAVPPARLTSSQDPSWKTALPSRLMAGAGMNSSTSSCSPQLSSRRSWTIVGAGSTTRSDRNRPSRG